MKQILHYLDDLKQQNTREWFAENKAKYEHAKSEFSQFTNRVAQLMLQHDNIHPKPKIYRIYRDVRFSKDKTPYKTHFSGSYSRQTALLRGGYYFQIEPGASFLAGGFWQPSKEDLLHLRQQIQQDAEPIRTIINSNDFKSYFGGIDGDKLKTCPKGFDKEDPNIDLLRYKNFLLMHHFSDVEVLNPDFEQLLNQGFMQMRPFFDVMSEYLTSNLNGEPLF